MPATFVKSRPAASDAYPAEAAGLAWLAAAGPGSARVVEVVEVTSAQLVLERLRPERPTRAAARDFGSALAITHAAGADASASRRTAGSATATSAPSRSPSLRRSTGVPSTPSSGCCRTPRRRGGPAT